MGESKRGNAPKYKYGESKRGAALNYEYGASKRGTAVTAGAKPLF